MHVAINKISHQDSGMYEEEEVEQWEESGVKNDYKETTSSDNKTS